VLPVAELSEQAVLITGAGRGLGRAIAVRLAQHGVAVGLVDIDERGCTETAATIRAAGGRAAAYAADVSNRASLFDAAGRFAREHAGLDAVINMSSPVAERGYPNTAMYSAVKGALTTLTKTLSAELGPRGVRVNALAPGSVPTPGAMGLNDKAEYERRARTIPLRRLGHEDDVAAAALFLLSPAAAFINGEILHIDGGIAAAG